MIFLSSRCAHARRECAPFYPAAAAPLRFREATARPRELAMYGARIHSREVIARAVEWLDAIEPRAERVPFFDKMIRAIARERWIGGCVVARVLCVTDDESASAVDQIMIHSAREKWIAGIGFAIDWGSMLLRERDGCEDRFIFEKDALRCIARAIVSARWGHDNTPRASVSGGAIVAEMMAAACAWQESLRAIDRCISLFAQDLLIESVCADWMDGCERAFRLYLDPPVHRKTYGARERADFAREMAELMVKVATKWWHISARGDRLGRQYCNRACEWLQEFGCTSGEARDLVREWRA